MRTRWLLLISTVAGVVVSEPAWGRTHANKYDAHCTVEPTASPADHQTRCVIDDPGSYDIDAEAKFKNGSPAATAELAISLDGRPCGKSETVRFDRRGSVFTGCRRRKLDGARHEVTLRVGVHMAEYDDMDIMVVRRPITKPGVPNSSRP